MKHHSRPRKVRPNGQDARRRNEIHGHRRRWGSGVKRRRREGRQPFGRLNLLWILGPWERGTALPTSPEETLLEHDALCTFFASKASVGNYPAPIIDAPSDEKPRERRRQRHTGGETRARPNRAWSDWKRCADPVSSRGAHCEAAASGQNRALARAADETCYLTSQPNPAGGAKHQSRSS